MATVDPLPSSGQTVPVNLDSTKVFREQQKLKWKPNIDKFLASQNPADLQAFIDQRGLADNEAALKQLADTLGTDNISLVRKAEAEIKRILSYDEKSYDEILNLDPSATMEATLKQWRELGCLLRPFIKQDDAQKQKNAARAFVRLLTAAKQKDVEDGDINEVVWWEGLVDLNKLSNASAAPLNETLPSEPPTGVREIHRKAVDEVAAFWKLNLQDKNMLDTLHGLNCEIIEKNRRNGLMRGEAYQWVIPLEFFHPQYVEAATRYKGLEADLKNPQLVGEIQKLKDVVDETIKRHHLASGWGIPSAEHYLEGAEEIKRIMSCSSDPYEVLKITQDSDENAKVKALRTITSMIHPIFSFHKDSLVALDKLLSAASRVDIDRLEIDTCRHWTGEDWEDDKTPPSEDPIEKPPQEILDLYNEASGPLLKLFDEPDNKQAKEVVERVAQRVRDIENSVRANQMIDEGEYTWGLDSNWWYMHTGQCAQYRSALRKNYEDDKAKIELRNLGSMIDSYVERNHFPDSLKLGTPEEYTDYLRNEEQEFKKTAQKKATDAEKHLSSMNDNLSKIPDESAVEQTLRAKLKHIRDEAEKLVRDAETAVRDSKSAAIEAQSSTCHFDAKLACEKAEDALARVSQMVSSMADLQVQALALVKDTIRPGVSHTVTYPWYTKELEGGQRLIAYRRAGAFGFRVCVERKEDGRLIRKIIAGADIGKGVAEKYSDKSGSKNMADSASNLVGQNLSYEDVKKLHWVASATPKVCDEDARPKSAEAYCCVALRDPKDVSLVTVTRFRMIAGKVKANEMIEKVCREQKTPIPWEQIYQKIKRSVSGPAKAKGGQAAPGTTLAPSMANGQAGNNITAIEARLATLEGEVGDLKNNIKTTIDSAISAAFTSDEFTKEIQKAIQAAIQATFQATRQSQ